MTPVWGEVYKIVQNNDPKFTEAVLEYIDGFWCERGVDFHLLPHSGCGLSLCLHITQNTDMYSLLSPFLDKFNTLP